MPGKTSCPYCHVGSIHLRCCDTCHISLPNDWIEAYCKMHGGVKPLRGNSTVPELLHLLLMNLELVGGEGGEA